MVSTRNTSRSHANPPRIQDQPGDVDSRPPRGTLETLHVNTDEMEALRLTNQRLLRELEQLTRKIQRPEEARQAREGQNTITREEEHLDPHREADGEGGTSHAREHDPYKPPGEDVMKIDMVGTTKAMDSSFISRRLRSGHESRGSGTSRKSSTI